MIKNMVISREPEIDELNIDESEINEVKSVESKIDEITIGTVSNCAKLNIRNAPYKSAGVVTTVVSSTELMIDLDKSANEWYYVYTASGIEGFCMKDFVSINR